MKKNFNLKLTAFLVSLFISMLVLILGSNNKYCLSFGFMLMGFSLYLFYMYSKEKSDNQLIEIEERMEELDQTSEENEETMFALKQLAVETKKIIKKNRSVCWAFTTCAVLLVFIGFITLF